MCTGIDRLNGIVRKMTQHGQPPTVEARLAKLKEALEIPSLNQLWLTIFLRANPTYDEIVGTCKRYDKAMEQQRLNVVGEAHLNTDTGKVVCSYPKCGKSGHTQANCWKKKKDQKTARSSKTEKDRKITFNAAAGEQKQNRPKIDSDWNKYI